MSAVMPPASRSPARSSARDLVRGAWESLSVYLPVILMALMALGTYWLARNTPTIGPLQEAGAPTHEPDSYMRGFSVKTFDAGGRLKSEIFGNEARHYPDTDTLEIDAPRIRSFGTDGQVTIATAKKAISNADGSEVQLIGDAVVTREAAQVAGHARPRLEFRGEFLHAFLETERVKSHKPVEITRGSDRYTADSLDYDNVGQVLDLKGRVNVQIAPRAPS